MKRNGPVVLPQVSAVENGEDRGRNLLKQGM
jgi:hypothetical protein